ncbi:MAG TPA: hypothetical protein VKZ78_00685 [Sphingobacteriaceae bacterium]|nr:hypothetical protein [Sphingobacteriaceae bacterium]
MSDRSKKIFLGICIIIPFVLYCYYYYSIMLNNAPFRYADFQSIVLTYGDDEDLSNRFDSETGIFTYLNSRDSLVSDTLRMRDDDLLYLHRKAAELGFWNLPEDMTGTGFASTDSAEVPRFILQYNYEEKSKMVTFDADFDGNPKMKDAARSVIDEVRRVLSDVRGR